MNKLSFSLLTLFYLISFPSFASSEEISFEAPEYLTNKKCRICHQNPEIFSTSPDCKTCHQVVKTDFNEQVFLQDIAFENSKKGSTERMAFVPAGEFIMGNNGRREEEGSGDTDETPEHREQTGAYYIDIYEVTNRDYKKYVDATGIIPPRHWRKGKIPQGKENHPVVYVNWKDGINYCNWSGKRLPTEEEWEKAARGPNGNRYPWGADFDEFKANTPQRWLLLDEKGHTMPVGSFKEGKSFYGLYDMSGNVWEWTNGWYRQYNGNKFPKTSYGKKYKVLKGGSWYNCLAYLCGLSALSSNRSEITPTIRNNSYGFRCAMTAN